MNQHYAEAQRLSAESSLVNEWGLTERTIIAARAQAEATLALAYEQRTANLVEWWRLGNIDGASIAQILERLGLVADR